MLLASYEPNWRVDCVASVGLIFAFNHHCCANHYHLIRCGDKHQQPALRSRIRRRVVRIAFNWAASYLIRFVCSDNNIVYCLLIQLIKFIFSQPNRKRSVARIDIRHNSVAT